MTSTKSRLNRLAKENKETGLNVNSRQSGGRFFQKDGRPNVRFRGVSYMQRFSVYQYMLKLPTWKFILFIACAYMIVNLLFACIYFFVGVHHLGGMEEITVLGKFWEAFFFSTQTLSTVGYGHVFPDSLTSNSIAAFESFTGILMLALATGLIYGRFSQPKPYLKYSSIALFAPFKDGYALMFRFAPFKQHFLTDVEVKVTCVMRYTENETERKNAFYSLDLELSKANSLASNWTIVHTINENSPLYQLTRKEIADAETEILVYVKGYDEEYANIVVSRSSYSFEEFIYGAKFDMMYEPSEDKTTTLLHMDKIDSYHEEKLPVNI
ncbi:Inward rectifier potassium channel Irk [Lacibacter luteus]|uniref:Inward rectifier potassium channel Irk n=1 Tax=Lacibacter luteus TaxID=2508719 RepID=A0A4Q1CLI1_9BACT|nr:ion channel [Lacibacter luteus]RXK61830.1 Inward rectifier potassium channel Irk [Lacibacter luteus]